MPRRSILITLDQDDDSVSSSIGFMRRLEELRLRYPTWRIRGIVHQDERLSFVPQKPPGSSPARVDDTANNEATRAHVDEGHRQHIYEDASSLGSDESDGNVIGQPPRLVEVGLRVQLREAPYLGRTGTVAEVQGERFRVEIRHDSGEGHSSWWCTAEDVVTLASERHQGQAGVEREVPLNTLDYIRVLERRIEELEQLNATLTAA